MTEELAREALTILHEIDAKKCNAIDRRKALNDALQKTSFSAVVNCIEPQVNMLPAERRTRITEAFKRMLKREFAQVEKWQRQQITQLQEKFDAL